MDGFQEMAARRPPDSLPACQDSRPPPPSLPQHFGKFRGVVADNIDPTGMAKLLVDVPQFPGMITAWAMPCTPYAGEGVGFFALPPIGANVWVEFENGDLNYPIWAGCFWGNALEVPAEPAVPTTILLKTFLCSLQLEDVPGVGATLTVEPNSLRVAQEVVEISVPPTSLTMTAEVFTVGVPPSTLVMGEEGTNIETPTLNIEAVVNITGDTNMEGLLTVTGDTSITGAFEVEGASSFEGFVNITGGVTIEGEAVVIAAGTVDIGGGFVSVEAGDMAIVGDVQVAGVVIAAAFIPPIL